MMYNFTPQAFKFIKNREREEKKRKLEVCVCVFVVVSVYVCENVPGFWEPGESLASVRHTSLPIQQRSE